MVVRRNRAAVVAVDRTRFEEVVHIAGVERYRTAGGDIGLAADLHRVAVAGEGSLVEGGKDCGVVHHTGAAVEEGIPGVDDLVVEEDNPGEEGLVSGHQVRAVEDNHPEVDSLAVEGNRPEADILAAAGTDPVEGIVQAEAADVPPL